MKRFVVIICFAIALPVAANDGALKGVRSVYIDTLNLFDQRDLVLALKQLPDVRVVSDDQMLTSLSNLCSIATNLAQSVRWCLRQPSVRRT